jgi:hypothetical protein
MTETTTTRELTPSQWAAVQELRHAALWYAWGRADGAAPDASGRNLIDAWQFAEEYAELARAYAAEEVGFRPSIMDALRDHIARRTPPEPEPRPFALY